MHETLNQKEKEFIYEQYQKPIVDIVLDNLREVLSTSFISTSSSSEDFIEIDLNSLDIELKLLRENIKEKILNV